MAATEISEFWLSKKIMPIRDDRIAVAYALSDLAKQGYVIDRLREIEANEFRGHWLYELPITRVVN